MTRRLTRDEFIKRSDIKHDHKYDYSLVKYIDARTNVEIVCPIHGPFPQTPDNHLHGQGCPECGKEKARKSKTYNTEEIIVKFNIKHDYRYDYSNVDYKGNHEEVEIICKEHGPFPQTPGSHLSGSGCPRCVGKSKTTEELIIQFNKIHDFRYDYTNVVYSGNKTNIEIICPIHGPFPQTPSNHLNGKGCSKCSGKLISNTQEFIDIANIRHDFKYDYSNVNYINTKTKVEIICPIHGPFPQTPNKHLGGHGCSKCVSSTSKPEVLWLNSLNLPDDKEHRSVYVKVKDRKRGYRVDGFDPETNTVYEFNGDFWHGNPSKFPPEDYNPLAHCTYGELYKKTLEKEALLKSAGYNVISIWESDFKASIDKTISA